MSENSEKKTDFEAKKAEEKIEKTEKFSIIILAAGLGKRMKNPEVPKVLATINDNSTNSQNPLIYYVLRTSLELNPEKICLIVGYKRELLIDYIENNFTEKFSNLDDKIIFAVQNEQLGTGHATFCAKNHFVNSNKNIQKKSTENILILAGDVPLLKSETLFSFIQNHNLQSADISVLSATAENSFGYGKIVRDSENNFEEIIEEKDASENQKLIKEINSGVYFLNANLLFDLLEKVGNSNNQNEYYLTDIIKIGKSLGKKVIAQNIAEVNEIQGINTFEQLKEIEKIINKK
jgi:UDP-N-acetylglucosamine diphosphorylase/glucosamine-1-phosphate N-acetyltransferase